MIALIDADIVCYRCAAASENEPLDIALARTDSLMREILRATNAEEYKSFLSGGNNFRYEINPSYKANRKSSVDPKWRESCKEFLVTEWNSIVTDGYEADDALGIEQDKETDSTVICTIDKDLQMIPGLHYNFVKQEFSEVDELQAIKTFYKQMLIGDTSDNVFGVPKIGKVKAAKIIDPLETEEEMFQTVKSLYDDEDRFWMNSNCLWIMRQENEKFIDRYNNV